MTLDTLERATGRWPKILPRLGIAPQFLQNKHGPCPICGRKDRFRFDDKDGRGTYFCGQCGAGSGVILLRKRHGWTHKQACDEIDRIIGNTPAAPVPQRPTKREGNIGRMQRYLYDARSPEVVSGYLQSRGLSIASPALRGSQRHPYFDQDGQLVGYYPAILAPIVGPDGDLRSVHQIYDADLDPRKKTMPPVGTINGAAVRLGDSLDSLGVAEGIETALACSVLFQTPTWAALTANGLQSFEPPVGIQRLRIFGDNDLNYVGQAAAYGLAKRICTDKRYQGIAVEVSVPQQPGTDWLNHYTAEGWQA